MNEIRDSTYDACSLFMFVDEGCLFQKILHHSKKYPQYAPYLANTIFPFCGLIVHDSIKFVRDHFDPSLYLDSQSVSRLRNATKSLSSTGLSVDKYTEEVCAIADYLSSKFKNHTGIFGNLMNSMQPDAGISYYNGVPIYTTYNLSRYLAKYNSAGLESIFDPDVAKQMGYDIGQAASPSFYTVEALGVASSIIEVNSFSVTNKDFHYSNLLQPITERGLTNPVYFFMLCEGLTQLNSTQALRESGFFSNLIEIKMTTAVLVAFERSLTKLCRYMFKYPEFENNPLYANSILSKLISKDQQKLIRKAKDLRNALIHYDFIKLLGEGVCRDNDAETILSLAIASTVKMTSSNYLDWLRGARKEITTNIAEIVNLPN